MDEQGMNTGPSAAVLGVPGNMRCARCDYDMAGLNGRTCPECGYVLTEDDLRYGERREVFMELTRGKVWPRVVLLCVLSMLYMGLPILQVALTIVAGYVAYRDTEGMTRRLLRRMWLLCLWPMNIVWVFPVVLTGGILIKDWLYWNTSFWWYDAFYEAVDNYEDKIVFFGFLVGMILSPVLFMRKWRRLAKIGGAERLPYTKRQVKLGLRVAYGPWFVFAAVAVLAIGIGWLLDAFWPGWWYEWGIG